MEIGVVGLFAFFALLVLVVAGVGFYLSHKRRQALREWAQQRGFSFQSGRMHSFDTRYAALRCLQQGSNRYADNIVQGRWGERTFCAFDYHYQTTSTDAKGRTSTQHYQFSVLVLDSEWVLKPLVIREEHFFDRLAQLVGFGDIEFELHEFNRAFHVSGPDRRWAFDVLHQETMEFLLKSPRFSIELHGPHVFAYRSSVLDAAEYEQALEVASGLVDRLPPSLIDEMQRSDASWSS